MAPVAGTVAGALGLAGTANAATGGIGGASGVLSGLSGFGSALGLGLGAGFSSIAAAGIGGWLSAGTSLIGTGTLGGIGAGLGLLAGPIGGVLAIGGLLSSLFGDDDPRYKFLTNSSNTSPGKLFEDGVFVKSAYGNIGFDDYAKNIDANKFLETFQAIAQLDNAIAATLSPSENDRIRQALDGYVSGKDEATVDYVANRLRIITDTVGGAIDQLADQFDGSSEEFVDYVSRLAQARTLIPALQDLGVALDGSSTAATQLALTLSDAFGGAQNAAQALAGYFQNYYTEAERVEVATRRLREAFAAIGVEMPATREAFRALVEAQDLTTESGRKTYAALLQVSGAFAEVTDASTAAAQAAAEAAQTAVDNAFAALKRAVDKELDAAEKAITDSYEAQRKSIEDQISTSKEARRAAEESFNTLQRLFDLLKSNINDLWREAGILPTPTEGRANLDQIISSVLATGNMPEKYELAEAITNARQGLEKTNYTTSFEQKRDRLLLANKLGELQLLVDGQITIEEQRLNAANTQIELLETQLKQAKDQFDLEMEETRAYYDQILENAQQQIDALRGIDNRVLSVSEAINNLAAAIAAAQNSAPSVLIGTLVRTRAQGGYTPSGLTLVGEEGPELINFRNPGMVYTAAQTSNLLQGDNSELIKELQALRSEVTMLRAEVRADVSHNAKVARILDRAVQEGDALLVSIQS